MRRRRLVTVVLVLVCAMLAAGTWGARRFRRTAEGIVLFGSGKERLDLCRAVPGLSLQRQKWVLRWLLEDPLENVRISAVAACGRIGPGVGMDHLLAAALMDPDCPPDLRTKAGEVLLLQRDEPPEQVTDYLAAAWQDRDFRRELPLLAAHYATWRLPKMDEEELRAVVLRSLDVEDPSHSHLQRLVLDNVESFAPLRDVLVAQVDRDNHFTVRQYALDCLTAMDGFLRGHSPEDWRHEAIPAAGADAACAFEAEWAHEIRPNYQIGEWKGVRCLALGEGAGGRMNWLKGYDATVDVGTARFPIWVPRDGNYRLWARVYLRDKCSNSFGIYVGGKQFTNFSDRETPLADWSWLPLRHGAADVVRFTKGSHRARLEAWEDGVYIDRFALLPPARRPGDSEPPSAVRWDASFRHSLSLSVEAQSQCRGTTQAVTVWVRRSTPELTGGVVRLEAPEAFRIVGSDRATIRFDEGNPLCRTSFLLELPADAVVGEGSLRADYTDESGTVVEGEMILGGQFDWLTTGPLAYADELRRKLSGRRTVSDEELAADFSPYPITGYDAYRRLDLEKAYGQLLDRYVYLACDIEVTDEGAYMALLTADDTAYVYIDGVLVISQPEKGPGEGRMVTRPVQLAEGRHRIFVQLYQIAKPDPVGPGALRMSPNHCNFKLLLRESRHRPATAIRGLPYRPRPDAGPPAT